MGTGDRTDRVDDDPEWRRLRALETTFDPGTFRRLEQLGIGAGMACLEIGPGAGSVLRWLADRVGATGRVVGVDLNPRYALRDQRPWVDVRQRDVAAGGLGENQFDLAHARLVLMHVREREKALGHMLRALKPGGWLLVEDADFDTARPCGQGPAAEAQARVFDAIRAFYRMIGSAPSFGRQLPDLFDRLGLQEVGVDGEVAVVRGGSPRARVGRLPLEHLGALLQGAGASADDLAHYRRLVEEPSGWFMDFALVAAWGRKP